MTFHTIYLAFGSSIGDRIGTIQSAYTLLLERGIIENPIFSSFYRSIPVDAPGDFYINSVIRGTTKLKPEELLQEIHKIEDELGRKRYAYHNTRTIDIDILIYGELTLVTPSLTLPHPRMYERAFVMFPLSEIAPGFLSQSLFIKNIPLYDAQGVRKLLNREVYWKGKIATMGILNITPDSFYDGGRYLDPRVALEQVRKMVGDGMDILDIGAQSSRPGYKEVSPNEELIRLVPILEKIRIEFPSLPISVDTYFAETLLEVEKYGIDIINDISGKLYQDERVIRFIRDKSISYIPLSHGANIEDIVEFYDTFIQQGISNIILDPGFGFGKTLDENYTVLSQMRKLSRFYLPILAGISRKSMIYRHLGISPDESLTGTTVLNTLALQNGASILRVHDVREAVESISIFNYYNSQPHE